MPDDEEGESLDDLLKTVDSKPVQKEEGNEDAGNAKVDESEAGSRRESVTKLPTGRQIRQQAVRYDGAYSIFLLAMRIFERGSGIFRYRLIPITMLELIVKHTWIKPTF